MHVYLSHPIIGVPDAVSVAFSALSGIIRSTRRVDSCISTHEALEEGRLWNRVPRAVYEADLVLVLGDRVDDQVRRELAARFTVGAPVLGLVAALPHQFGTHPSLYIQQGLVQYDGVPDIDSVHELLHPYLKNLH